VKNALALTLLAVGTPMLLMGDEIRRTQRGNNNAYCINDETTWFDWDALARHADVHRFVTHLIALRNGRELAPGRSTQTLLELLQNQPIAWHGVELNAPDWGDDSHSLAATTGGVGGTTRLHLVANAFWEPLRFAIPPTGARFQPWRRLIDTSLNSPDDIRDWTEAPVVGDAPYVVGPRSLLLLMATAEIGSRTPLRGTAPRRRADIPFKDPS